MRFTPQMYRELAQFFKARDRLARRREPEDRRGFGQVTAGYFDPLSNRRYREGMGFKRDLHATRREVLTGLAVLAFAPGPREGAPGVSLRAILDRAAVAVDSSQILALLRQPQAEWLDRGDRGLLRMVVRGLERELDLRRRFPIGKADGSSPYVISHRHGAFFELREARAGSRDTVRQLDGETERLRAEAARGVRPPRFILDAVLQAELELATKAVPEVTAALGRQIALLRQLRAGGDSAPGVSRLPGGRDYYRLRLRCTSGMDASPAEIERQVAGEIARLMRRADRLLKALGLERGGVGERLRVLRERPGHLYSNDEAGRARAVGDMNSALARLRPHLPAWFNSPLELASAVRRMTAADERAGRRGYREAASAAAPGAYYPDLAAVQERPAWTLTTVAYHETLPGHLFQLGRQALANPHPLQVRYAPGYSEGWAIYAEALVDAMSLLSPVEQLGFIQSLLFRLARVVADIGIHWHRWERAQAIRYLEETVGFELFFPFAVEVDRYAAEPAGFAGDAMVALTLRRLRPPAGPGLRAFHEAVLNRGPVSAETIPEFV
jgi:uncharacterized protein (DUF885 family)